MLFLDSRIVPRISCCFMPVQLKTCCFTEAKKLYFTIIPRAHVLMIKLSTLSSVEIDYQKIMIHLFDIIKLSIDRLMRRKWLIFGVWVTRRL